MKSRIKFLFRFTILGFCMNSAFGSAEGVKPPLIILDLEARGTTTLVGQAATLSVVRGIRQLDVFQVLSSDDVRQMLAIERNKQLIGMASSNGGMADLGKTLGADNAITGTVSRLGQHFQVEIRLLNTAASQVLSQKIVEVKDAEEMAQKIPGLAQELVGPLLRDQQGSLLVRTQEEAAEIWVDDLLVGSTPLRAPIKLPRGTHRLQVRKTGFIAQSESDLVEPNHLTLTDITLLPSADYAEAYRRKYAPLRTGAIVATVVAVTALASGIILDRVKTEPQYQNEFAPRQLALRDGPLPPGSSDNFKTRYQTCGADPASCRSQLSSLNKQVQTQEIISGSLVAIGLIAGGVATYLWLTGKDPSRYADLVAGFSVGDDNRVALGIRF